MIDTQILKSEERAVFALRALYRQYGYLPYKMSKFESYEYYIQNKDFLVSDRIITFGFNPGSTYSASDLRFDSNGYPEFNVVKAGEVLAHIHLSIPGEHNIANSLAAFAACHTLGVDPEDIQSVLDNFHGTQRRFDVIGKTENDVMIIDDYAHHPTEIKATLKAIRNMKHRTLWCLFQPHTYTRTMALLDDFGAAFDNADEIILAEIYAARETNIYKISSRSIMEKIHEHDPSKHVFYIEDFEDIASFVYERAGAGDLVLTMGAGDINKVGKMILDKINALEATIIGNGAALNDDELFNHMVF
jgi:UDP-N-acetylmuramate--alanine ligase